MKKVILFYGFICFIAVMTFIVSGQHSKMELSLENFAQVAYANSEQDSECEACPGGSDICRVQVDCGTGLDRKRIYKDRNLLLYWSRVKNSLYF